MPDGASGDESWRRRIYLPTYQVQEAARYAHIAPKTVVGWQKGNAGPALAPRDHGVPLSYMQLIEVAVVSALRKAGVSLQRIRQAREFVSEKLTSEYPFAEYRFKNDGRNLFMDFDQVVGSKRGRGKLIRPDQYGQLAWDSIIGKLNEFEYERRKIVTRWHLAGPESQVTIDPRIYFGTPAVKGIPTWAIKGRWDAGETPPEIAEDFRLRKSDIVDALIFEGIDGLRMAEWQV